MVNMCRHCRRLRVLARIVAADRGREPQAEPSLAAGAAQPPQHAGELAALRRAASECATAEAQLPVGGQKGRSLPLSAAQLAFYERWGFLRVPSAFSAAEMGSVLAAVDVQAEAASAAGGATGHGPWIYSEAAWYILYGKSPMKYTKRRLNDSVRPMARQLTARRCIYLYSEGR